MKGKILRFLRVIQPLHFSRRFTLGPIPPSLKRSLAVAPKAVGPTKPKRRQAVGPRGCLKAFNKGAQRCCKVAKGPPSSSHWAPWKGKKSSTPNPLGPWSWGAGPDETCWKHKHQKQKKMLKLRTSPTNICLGGGETYSNFLRHGAIWCFYCSGFTKFSNIRGAAGFGPSRGVMLSKDHEKSERWLNHVKGFKDNLTQPKDHETDFWTLLFLPKKMIPKSLP